MNELIGLATEYGPLGVAVVALAGTVTTLVKLMKQQKTLGTDTNPAIHVPPCAALQTHEAGQREELKAIKKGQQDLKDGLGTVEKKVDRLLFHFLGTTGDI